MTQTMIIFLVGLAILLAVAFVRRYMSAHPGERMTQWLDAHHMRWMHHKH
jgi:hypothetical protein